MPNLPFGFERAEDSPGFLLWQTTMIWQRQIIKALAQFEISHSQFVIMATLLWFAEHNIGPTQVAIANWSKLDKMTVSKSLKNLATQELVRRSEHLTDTRAKSVVLTDIGKELVHKLVPIVESIDAKFFGKVSASEQQSLLNILGKLTLASNN
jgi:MarR family transcriptional regulator, organic hydroperoxide resistance regulator